MIEKLNERRVKLVEEYNNLFRRYNEALKFIEDSKERLAMINGHVSEVDFQISELEKDKPLDDKDENQGTDENQE